MTVPSRTARAGVALFLACAWMFVGVLDVAAAQESDEIEAPPSLLLVMDSSGSMRGSAGGGVTKIQAAKQALVSVVDELPDDVVVGLRVYGHRVPNTDKARGCKDTELITPVGPLRRAEMKQQIRSYDAKGFTPIGLSLREAAADLPSEGPRTIVLVSDGIDTCAPPDPCKVARRIVARGIDLRIDTVGFQVNPAARRQLRCIARAGKGTYVDAASAAELSGRLQQLSVRALRRYVAAGLEVRGGETPDAAPLIAPGQYVEQMPIKGTRWYAVSLAEGQVLKMSGTFVAARPSGEGGPLNTMTGTLFNPQLEALIPARTSRPTAAALGGPPKALYVESDPIGSKELLGPGLYFVRIRTNARSDTPVWPLELRVGIYEADGRTPVASGAGEETPSESEGETPGGGQPEPNDEPNDESEPASGAAVALALLGPAGLGAVAGFGLVRALRRGRGGAAILMVVVAWALVAEPAAAQRAELVEGGGSFNDAPILTPGTYRDTLRNDEFTFYAVALGEGQGLDVRARIRVAPNQAILQRPVVLEIHNPWGLRDFHRGPGALEALNPGTTARLQTSSPPVGGGTGSRGRVWSDPGVYYFGFINYAQEPRRAEHQVTFTLEVTGEGTGVDVPEPPTPEILGTPGTPAPETPTPQETSGEGPGSAGTDPVPPGGDGAPSLVRYGLVGLLAGLGGGAGLGLVRARP